MTKKNKKIQNTKTNWYQTIKDFGLVFIAVAASLQINSFINGNLKDPLNWVAMVSFIGFLCFALILRNQETIK